MGFFKLNIDGSACGNSSRAIAGGLTRNCKVAWIEGVFFFFFSLEVLASPTPW